ncbi:MAG: MBL fold metallo-hydrolase [Chitinophagaceae bacterium]|nr:MBL fold metallo-hydrolase [Chitinophagaceae bacterium]
MKLHVIHAGNFKLDGGAMFGIVPKSMWQKLNPPDENNMCTWSMRCLLIEEGRRLVLVDNGIGDKQDAKFFGHYYLDGKYTLEGSLKSAGFSKDDITDVFQTHLHFDHCGGAIIRQDDKLVPAFKNATYWSNAAHWKWATEPNDREKASFLKENILPIQESGKLKFVEEIEGIGFMKNVNIRFVNGHTDAMMLPQINYNGKTIVYMADLLPSVPHIPIPYVMAYDTRPLLTLKEKKSFLQEAYENKYTLFFEHDAYHECCDLRMTEKGIRSNETFDLAKIL